MTTLPQKLREFYLLTTGLNS